VFTAGSDARAMVDLSAANADTTLQRRFAGVSASASVSTNSRVPLGDQFAASASKVRGWAEQDLVAAVEAWPDDDWSDL
jgi:hypothetical protein